jgi:hypothetical protein|tara:strand:- start:3 stop:161 length:159 start_codon:yes stop_codon:yes gene_type:complete
MKIKKINPIARLMAYNRRRKQVLPNKKKYDRKKVNKNLISSQVGNTTNEENK